MFKLSEFMRLGSMASAPIHGPYYVERDGECFTCALGSALFAAGYTKGRSHWTEARTFPPAFFDQFPILGVKVIHPETCDVEALLFAVISLFEIFGWSRERIADFVATIEAQEEAKAVAAIQTPVEAAHA